VFDVCEFSPFLVVDGYVQWYRWCRLSNIVGTGRVLAMVLNCCICYLLVPRGVFYGVSKVCGWLHFPFLFQFLVLVEFLILCR
jgi:hypothetical protein